METSSGGLPAVKTIGLAAPFRWLGGAWSDLLKAPAPCLTYGLALSIISILFARGIYETNAAYWVLMLTCGFIFIAPMLAMGLYEAGRLIEAGERPTLARMVLVRAAFRQDIAYLGLMLLVIFTFWITAAQIVYGLSTYQIHRSVPAFFTFAFTTDEGRNMLGAGSIIGGLIAFFTYCLVAISTPMLLDRDTNVFFAIATSIRAVNRNFAPMLLWAVIVAVLTLATAATAFVGLIVVFPLLGLASWRAYRDIVADRSVAVEQAAAA